MKRQVTPGPIRRGTMRLFNDLTVLEGLTREPRRSAYALLETRLGPETTQLALVAAGVQQVLVPRTVLS